MIFHKGRIKALYWVMIRPLFSLLRVLKFKIYKDVKISLVLLPTYLFNDDRTEVNHPASGITTFTYDALGNVLTKQTANLAKEGKSITYDYDYHRLTGINYPDHPENNVK